MAETPLELILEAHAAARRGAGAEELVLVAHRRVDVLVEAAVRELRGADGARPDIVVVERLWRAADSLLSR